MLVKIIGVFFERSVNSMGKYFQIWIIFQIIYFTETLSRKIIFYFQI
jgi:hypothetical protein